MRCYAHWKVETLKLYLQKNLEFDNVYSTQIRVNLSYRLIYMVSQGSWKKRFLHQWSDYLGRAQWSSDLFCGFPQPIHAEYCIFIMCSCWIHFRYFSFRMNRSILASLSDVFIFSGGRRCDRPTVRETGSRDRFRTALYTAQKVSRPTEGQ